MNSNGLNDMFLLSIWLFISDEMRSMFLFICIIDTQLLSFSLIHSTRRFQSSILMGEIKIVVCIVP